MSIPRITEILEGEIVGSSSGYQTYADEVDASNTYVGESAPGVAVTTAAWRIKKVVVAGTITTVKYADGVSTFTKIWNSRTGYSY